MNKREENKQENKKSRGVFIGVMAASLLIGALIGLFGHFASTHWSTSLGEAISWFLQKIMPWGTPLSVLLLLAVYFPLYGQAKNIFRTWNQEDESVIERAEHKLDILMLWQSILQIFCYFSFGCGAICIKQADSTFDWITNLACILGLFAFLIAMTMTQRRVVDLVKEMNPEKHGSVYDMNFQKKWLGSCDEAEKLMIYESAFHAYKVTNTACLTLWLVLVITSMFIPMTITALACVSLIWLLQTVSYSLWAMRLGKKSAPGGTL